MYGFSYPSRWVETNKVQEFPVNPRETTYTIGLLHGDLASQSEHYAPFTVPDLLSKQYDYWALGHIHQARVLNQVPLIQYAGTIQGRHRNEAGDKGAYLVELQPGQPTRSQFVSLAAIVWSQTSIECQATWQAADLMEEIQAVMASYQDQAETSQQSQIVVIHLEEAQRLSLELQEQIESGQVIDSLPAAQVDPGESFTVLAQLRLERNVHGDPFDYDDQLDQSFEAAYQSLQSGEGYRAVMALLFDHAIMQTYFQDLTLDADLQADLVQEARDLVIQAIGTEGKGDHDED